MARLERRELWTPPHRSIVSSNSDFTRLAVRIRASGLTVHGFGSRKTPKPFVAACDKFIYVENLNGGATPAEAKPVRATAVNRPTTRGTRARRCGRYPQRRSTRVSSWCHSVRRGARWPPGGVPRATTGSVIW
ncbi:NYN domain-containing protein [Streptomyces scabiei]|uniref:NYN domain-containing protein n=1 Tax=Streptomyces scabiei TaxID=1930 RepID=UPI0038F68B3B